MEISIASPFVVFGTISLVNIKVKQRHGTFPQYPVILLCLIFNLQFTHNNIFFEYLPNESQCWVLWYRGYNIHLLGLLDLVVCVRLGNSHQVTRISSVLMKCTQNTPSHPKSSAEIYWHYSRACSSWAPRAVFESWRLSWVSKLSKIWDLIGTIKWGQALFLLLLLFIH